MKVETITFTMLNSIPTRAIIPRIHIHVISIGTNVISVSSILPYINSNAMKTTIPVNATMRKAIRKTKGQKVAVLIEVDNDALPISPDLLECLQDEPKALKYFQSLPGSHQRYFSKWIDSAKTIDTKAKRIALSVKALAQKKGYGEMIRANKKT